MTSVTMATLGGQPTVISGGNDLTVRVWDLGTGSQIDVPFISRIGPIRALTCRASDNYLQYRLPVNIAVGAQHGISAFKLFQARNDIGKCEEFFALELQETTLSAMWADRRTIIVATDSGIAVFELPDRHS